MHPTTRTLRALAAGLVAAALTATTLAGTTSAATPDAGAPEAAVPETPASQVGERAGATATGTHMSAAYQSPGQDEGSLERLYRAYFLRAPDTAGLAYWRQRLDNGMDLPWISDEFSRSAEFRSRYGTLNNTDFVRLIYRNVLHRDADAAGLAAFVGALDAGATRGQIMLSFSDSSEFKNLTNGATAGEDAQSVERLYRAYFLRAPDAGGLAYWHGIRSRGVSLANISEEFARSAEFRIRYGSLSNRDFVNLVYRNVLSRQPDAGGFTYWVGLLDRGLTRGHMMIGFSDSPEFKTVVARIGSAPAGSPTSYTFSQTTTTGAPITWDPCKTIRVVVNYEGAPTGSSTAIKTALAHLSETHKISWVYEGVTTERYDTVADAFRRPQVDLARYGDRFAPVLISWPRNWGTEPAVGYGGFSSRSTNGSPTYAVTGMVVLNNKFVGNTSALTGLVLHELGHVANLGHAPTSDQVMSAALNGKDRYQNGDRAGLTKLGGANKVCTQRAELPGSSDDTSVADLDGTVGELTGVLDYAAPDHDDH